MSNTPFVPGKAETPDARCQTEKPAGVTAAMALIAYTSKPASAALDPTALYVRPDGTLVGTGAQIAAGGNLESGIWQSADGRYVGDFVWTGQENLDTPGTAATTCGDWTDRSSISAVVGTQSSYQSFWWFVRRDAVCNPAVASTFLYCVQTAP